MIRVSNPVETGIVHLWDLPGDLVYVDIKTEWRNKLLNALRDLTQRKSWDGISKLINVKPSNITAFISRDGKVRLKLLKKMVTFLTKKGYQEFSLNNLETKIIRLGAKKNSKEIINPKLPFNFKTTNGGRFISAILHDGGINKGLQPFYMNYNGDMKKLVKKSVIKIFGNVQGKIDGKKQLTFPTVIGVILVHCLGLPYGRKVMFNPGIPKFIFSNKRTKTAFVKQAFDDDGTVSIDNRSISLKLYRDVTHFSKELREKIKKSKSSNFVTRLLLDNKKILESLDITVKGPHFTYEYLVVKDNKKFYRYGWSIIISSFSEIKKFLENVNFEHLEKRKKLLKLLNNYKQMQYKNPLETALKFTIAINNEKGFFTSSDLMKETKRSISRVYYYLHNLERLGLIKKIKPLEMTCSGAIPAVFTLTERGQDILKSPESTSFNVDSLSIK